MGGGGGVPGPRGGCLPPQKIGPADPEPVRPHEASWSGTPRSAGYEWTQRASSSLASPARPLPLIGMLDTEPLDRPAHTSRAEQLLNFLHRFVSSRAAA